MNSDTNSETARELFRHALATVAYRAAKAVRNAPETFSEFRGGEGLRTPGEILAHVGDLFDWGLSIARGKQEWHNSRPLPWDKEVERFFVALQKFDEYLASGAVVHESLNKLLQGPVADALSHVGQIAMLRRMAGVPVRAENFHKAEIQAGRAGADQASPKLEF
jgi:hypothetical protein